ncbi:putative proline oxidase Put1 [Aspergillus clavatus NRRL 1]|uniref:Proline dehydrogenase n=1 Tax=Aspergillus clavatus (strain ATCC 1007 / CBS 513.65 / DSM 816 / NCTC 3887 / NRRL 1 / QM 1276 / 107) TaxID=344612 RepID=A1CCH9_ASPCL|nr:uncharacterized protein ACLA_061990 [Aspergillus clavatus NRRL 1]EAW12236.1 predicted protein [Aspergillus clavatus NRRL 1]
MAVKCVVPKTPRLQWFSTAKYSPFSVATSTSTSPPRTHNAVLPQPSPPSKKAPLAVLPTGTLLRSLLFTSIMSSPLLDPCLSIMKSVVNSKSPILSPSKNPVINYILRKTIYNHFCAGTNETEVRKTVQDTKALGFKGVILGYARESIAKTDGDSHTQFRVVKSQRVKEDQAVEEWKQGNLRTLSMIGAGDFLGIKFTGAGPAAVEALSRGDPLPPSSIQQAITEICAATASQASRLWIDAEQQIFQPAIDAWTINLMRRFNRNGTIVVYNTIQAYLKSSTDNVQRHLRLAQNEGWTLGIKLVRGAYIAHDIRAQIHDSKAATDRNYDHIVESLLTRRFPLGDGDRDGNGEDAVSFQRPHFPDVRLFVASHNAGSVWKASLLYTQRMHSGLPTIPVEVGQLQGMADEVSCELLGEKRVGDLKDKGRCSQTVPATPGVFKCLAWGTTEECLHFLLRRAVENKSAMERTRDTAVAMRREAWRRFGW